MNPLFLGVLAAAGVHVVTREDDTPVARPSTPTKPRAASALKARLLAARPTAALTVARTSSPLAYAQTTNASRMNAEAELAIKDELRHQFSTMTADAKRRACEQLKDSFPDDSAVQALSCSSMTFDQMMKAVSASISGACSGPACGALGVVAAEFFGEDINALWSEYQIGVTTDAQGNVAVSVEGQTIPTSKEQAVAEYQKQISGAASAIVGDAPYSLAEWVQMQANK